MKTCFQLLLLLALAVVFMHHRAADAAVEDTCKAAVASSPEIKYDFCVAALKSDPASGGADNKGLAIISTSLSAANATGTAAKIKSMLKRKPEKKAKACLDTCLGLYNDAINTLNVSVGKLRSGQYVDARTYLSASLDAPGTCEDTFGEMGVPSLLAKEDANSQQLSNIALTIAGML